LWKHADLIFDFGDCAGNGLRYAEVLLFFYLYRILRGKLFPVDYVRFTGVLIEAIIICPLTLQLKLHRNYDVHGIFARA